MWCGKAALTALRAAEPNTAYCLLYPMSNDVEIEFDFVTHAHQSVKR
jgi:hypothetical protein